MWRARRLVVGAAVLLAMLVGTSGVASATSAAQYAKTYCAKAHKWRVTLAKDEAAFHTATGATTDLAGAKQQVVTFLRTQAKGAGATATALDDTGAPDVKGGAKFNAAMVKNLDAFRDRLGVLADNAELAKTSDPTAFAKAMEPIDGGGFAKALLTYDRATTKAGAKSRATLKALTNQAACQALS